MSNQSFTNRIMDPEERSNAMHELSAYESRNRRPLIVGALLGLLLGLFIAWVVWPIQWSNAWPPDLAQQAKADYIAAVADAFVASRSDEAADLAYRRLSSFGDDMQTELGDAVLYFETHPSNDGAVRINNIQELAAAIQPVPTPVPTAEDTDTAFPAEVDEPADLVTPVEPEDPSNWLQRTLWLLAALALIVGGILVLRAVTRPQPTEPYPIDDDDDEIDEFDQDDLYAYVDESPGQDETPTSADRSVATETATAAAATVMASEIDMDVDEAEEGEVDVEILATDSATENPSISVRSGTAGAALDSAFLADQEEYGFGPETDLPTDGGSTTVVVDAEPEPEVNSAGEPEEESDEATATAGADAAFLTPGRELGRYSAVYYPMSDEYAEAFRIEDDADAGYVGECGMGVNMKYGLVQRNPEQVAALDVWLVDHVEKTATSYHSQTLISKYGVAQMSDENQDGDEDGDGDGDEDGEQQSTTLTAPAAGDHFQIVGEHLLVDCEVVKASYMEGGVAAGVFQGLELKLVVS